MKILRVIDSMNPASGGPCQGIRNVIPDLEKLDVKNEVVCMDAPDADYLGSDNFLIHAVGPASGPWHYNAKLIPFLLENFNRFDIVIIHGLWIYHSYAVTKAIAKYRKQFKTNKLPRILVMPHGMLDPYFQKSPDRKIKALRNWVYWNLLEEKVVERADGVLFTCEAELILARETFKNYHPKKEFNVSYGIIKPPAYSPRMTDLFNKTATGLYGNPYLLFLSRIHQKKGVNLLIKGYENLLEKGKTLPKLVIAGPGLDERFGKEMIKLVAESEKLKDNVIFTGMLKGDAKWGAFYGCEAFILPSHQENFGIAVAEALACGKPVLISEQINIWHEIARKDGGIVSTDTLEGVEYLLNTWIKLTPQQKEQKGKLAFETYQDYFTVENSAKKLKQVLQQITN